MPCISEDKFVWNTGTYLSNYIATHPGRQWYEINFSGQGIQKHCKISFKTESAPSCSKSDFRTECRNRRLETGFTNFIS